MSRGERPRTDLSSGSREDPALRRPGFRSPACRTVRPCAPVVEAPLSVVLGVAAQRTDVVPCGVHRSFGHSAGSSQYPPVGWLR